ncbi:MAG TPA: ABC transporter permease subunit [Paenibacillus sp.]|nr:ABC transporter permease subunit [Paenibacillus sp.]
MKQKAVSLHYYLMVLPGILFLLAFHVAPMFGIVIAFQKFIPARGIFGSQWIGLDNFLYMLQIPDSKQVFANTIVIAAAKIAAGIAVPVGFALLLNEVRISAYKRTIQTDVYMPHFLSWVILSGAIVNLFAFDGIVNRAVEWFGGEPVMFLASNTWFRPILVLTDVWKEFGFGTIIYLAAIAGINPALYEAAVMDGASRWQQMAYVTLPGIAATVVLMATLSLGNVLNAGFDQIFNLYNPLVYRTADIIDTYVYRVGLVQMQYGLATSVGLLKSVVSFLLIIISYKLAARYANYRIF